MDTEDQPEYFDEPAGERVYSSFWPLAIIIAGLIGWSGYQVCITYAQGSDLAAGIKGAQPAITAAQTARSRLYALAQDLVQTGAKDQFAAQIAKENNIQIKSTGGSAGGSTADH